MSKSKPAMRNLCSGEQAPFDLSHRFERLGWVSRTHPGAEPPNPFLMPL
ncbi:hypothetical protein [Longilinea arvoryzae]|nr:hypothetical protein [Longilinea arvoryzae]